MTVSVVHVLEMVDVKNHERDRRPRTVQLFLFAEKHTAKASTVEAAGQRIFLAGLFVFALFDFESAEVPLQLFLLFPIDSAFTAIVKEPDNQDDKERDKPESDKRRHEVHLRNLLALKAQAPDFPAAIAERSVRPSLDFNKRDVRKIYTSLMDIDFVLGDPPARHAEFLRDKHGRIRLLRRGKFNLVELEGRFVILAVKRLVVTAHVKTDRAFIARLQPYKNAIIIGEVAAHGLAITKINLDPHIRVGIAFAEFVFNYDGAIGTHHRDRRSSTINGICTSNYVGIFTEINLHDIV